jgi:hypothetical protein
MLRLVVFVMCGVSLLVGTWVASTSGLWGKVFGFGLMALGVFIVWYYEDCERAIKGATGHLRTSDFPGGTFYHEETIGQEPKPLELPTEFAKAVGEVLAREDAENSGLRR